MNPSVRALTRRCRSGTVVKGYSIRRGSNLTVHFNVHGMPAIVFVGSNRIISGRINTTPGSAFRRGLGNVLWVWRGRKRSKAEITAKHEEQYACYKVRRRLPSSKNGKGICQ